MLERLLPIWDTFGSILDAIPTDISTVVVTVFCLVGIVGVMRSI